MLQHSINPQDVRLSPEETRALLGVYQKQYEDGTTLGNVAETIGANPHELYVMLEQMRAQKVTPVARKRKTLFIAAAGISGAMMLYGAIWSFWVGHYFHRTDYGPAYVPVTAYGPSYVQFENLMGEHQYKPAYQMGWQILPQMWNDQTQLNEMAWTIVNPDSRPSVQDLKLAKKAAERAVSLTGGDDWRNLDTLAAVYNDMGSYSKASDTELNALLKADSGSLDSVRTKLKMYRDAAETAKSGKTPDTPAVDDGTAGTTKTGSTSPDGTPETTKADSTTPDATPGDVSTSH